MIELAHRKNEKTMQVLTAFYFREVPQTSQLPHSNHFKDK
jgi:hypothetical protein